MSEAPLYLDEWTGRLSEYLDGELEPAERHAADEHLRGCAGCRAVLEDLGRVRERAHALRDRPPAADLWRDIARQIGHPEAADDPADELAARRRRAARLPWLRVGAAAAAVLAVGIGIGRVSAPGPATLPTEVVGAPGPGTPLTAGPYRLMVAQHLARSEALLTEFRADARRGSADADVARWADELLTRTRLLLDSPAAADPSLRALLDDLELVLVQIAQLPRAGDENEAGLAERAIERSGVLPRMRSLVPAGPSATTIGET